ncbi:MAG TPA: flagellar motor protein MotB [Hyphomonadaceae bacterium]|jgi:chemotaxis protein MotB|nr:flagellar motor protein MotB [Hyphomonadaceae bacterium]
MSGNERPIIIKKVKKVVGGGHHGGAWKVAYADFVTAMMAFFLLMWLINTTSPEQKRGIADYFAPASVSRSTQGSDGLLGGTAFQEDGARASGSNRPIKENQTADAQERRKRGGGTDGEGKAAGAAASDEAVSAALERRAKAAEESIRQALQDMPDMAELSKQVFVDQTPEGMRIQIVDQEGRAMFAGSSAEPLPRTKQLLEAVAKVIQEMPNRISISGHTDTSAPAQSGYTNWDLSSDRANAARRILSADGVDNDRIYQVSGKAAEEPLYPDDPDQPANRRISIVLLNEAPVLPSDHAL